MSTGYPDFFGMSIFPDYGRITYKQGDPVMTGNALLEVFLVGARGIVKGGCVFAEDTDFDVDAQFYFLVDGVYLPCITFSEFQSYNYAGETRLPLSLTYYDPDAGKMALHFSMDIVFLTSFGLFCNPVCGAGAYALNYIFYYVPIVE